MARYECIKLDCKIRGICESVYDIDSPPCAKLVVENANSAQQLKAEIRAITEVVADDKRYTSGRGFLPINRKAGR